jgi:hypothetical protein
MDEIFKSPGFTSVFIQSDQEDILLSWTSPPPPLHTRNLQKYTQHVI